MHLREVIPLVEAKGKGIKRYYAGVGLNAEGEKRYEKGIIGKTAYTA
jgi:hypothetical protein